MNQYEAENVTFKIDGYFHPTAHEQLKGDFMPAFDRAKAELIEHRERELNNIKAMMFDSFAIRSERKREIRKYHKKDE